MYSLFFPVYKYGQGRAIDVLRPIDQYVLPNITPEIINSDNIASLIAYMINMNFMHESDIPNGSIETLNTITASILFHLSAKYFGIPYDKPNSLEQIYNLINSFSYDALNMPFLGLESYKLFCEEEKAMFESDRSGNFSILSLCSGTLTSNKGPIHVSDNCKWYCWTVVNNRSTHELVKSFYDMSVDLEGPLVSDYPATLLPVCRFPREGKQVKDGCWRKIVSDKGICFASDTGG